MAQPGLNANGPAVEGVKVYYPSVLAQVVCPELLQGTKDEEFFERVT